MERQDRAILEPINLENCNPGSEIHSDEWGAYCHPDTLGFVQRQSNASTTMLILFMGLTDRVLYVLGYEYNSLPT